MSRLSLFAIPLWVAVGACSLAQPGAETASAASEEPVMVAILWHQHQPHYLQDPETGEYTLPWVRMHAVKDYVDMITILDDHPTIHFTVNLTPVLIGQINDLLAAWDEGRPTDAFVRHTLLDADALTDAEKDFIRRNFFSINWGRILERYPRYAELRDRREDPLDTWTAQDFRDLQMLFNLGWMDPDFQDGATLPDGTVIDVGDWIAQGRDFTEEDKAELIAMHFAILRQVIAVHRAAQDRGQIEVTTTPYYHPILPLICDTESAREASPNITLPGVRFQRPADAALHVRRAVAQYEDLFDRPPRGLWPAEGSVSQAIVPLLADAGLDWFASDVHVLARSIGVDDPPAAQRFSMWSVANPGGEPLAAVFRDTGLSDLIGFTYSGRNGTEATEDFVGILRSIRAAIQSESDRPVSQHVIPIILDGENCWENYENDGKEFLHALYTRLAEDPLLETVTLSECLARSGERPTIEHLHAGSWINANFETWIGEPEENRAWELLAAAGEAFDEATFETTESREAALELLMIAEGSDWFWWYGADQSIDNEESFDESFHGTLAQLYTVMGLEVPAAIDEPIMQGAGAASGGGVMARGTE